MTALEELYREQVAQAELDGRPARIAELKRRVADEEEGRKARVALADDELEKSVAAYGPALDTAIDAWQTYVEALAALQEASARRTAALRRARALDIEIPPAAFDSFTERLRHDTELDRFARTRAIGVTNAGWPR